MPRHYTRKQAIKAGLPIPDGQSGMTVHGVITKTFACSKTPVLIEVFRGIANMSHQAWRDPANVETMFRKIEQSAKEAIDFLENRRTPA